MFCVGAVINSVLCESVPNDCVGAANNLCMLCSMPSDRVGGAANNLSIKLGFGLYLWDKG